MDPVGFQTALWELMTSSGSLDVLIEDWNMYL